MKHTHTSRLSVGVVVFAFLAQAHAAQAQAPSIAAISGSATQGAVLTISGANLNAERLQNIDNWFVRNPNAWSFEGPDPQSDGYLNPGGTGNGVYDSTFKLLGNKSIKFRSIANNPDCTTGGKGQSYNYLMLDDASAANEYWVRVYASWNRLTNWPTNYIKMLNAIGAGYYFEPGGATAGTNPGSFDSIYSGASHYSNISSGKIQNRRWYAIEVHWRNGTPRVFDAYVDGVLVHSGSPSGAPGAQGQKTLLFGTINGCGSGSWDVEHWMDGLVVSSQRIFPSAIVEVGDGPNYSTANRKPQALESIADNQISFRLDTSGLGSGPYYVWVRNNAQSLSPAFFLTGGQVSGPVAPSNLRIIP